MNTPQVEINRRNSPQIKRSFALLTAATSTAYGPAVNIGHGFAFAIFVKGTGATGTNRIIIEARNEANVWATWKDIAVATGNTTQLVEAISAVSAVRAKVTPYGGGSFDVTVDVLNVKAIEQGATPATIDWSNLTNKPATFASVTHTHAASEVTDSTAAGRTLLTAASASAQRTALDVNSVAEVAGLRTGLATRPGIISTGASAVGTTQDNTGLAFGTGDLSIGAWVRLPDWTPASSPYIVNKFAANLGVQLRVSATGELIVYLGTGATATAYQSTVATGVADGAWAHISVTLDRDGNLLFWVNGAQLGAAVSIAAQSAQTLSNTGPVYWLANSNASTAYAGTLGETYIVSGLLTATNNADIYRAGSIAPFSSSFTFFQWCDFGQGYGPIIKDRSGQNQPALMGTSGLTHAVSRNPPGVPQRAPRTAIVSDGAALSKIYNTLNTQNPGTGDVTVLWDGVLPTIDTSLRTLFVLSSSATTTVAAKALIAYWSTSVGLGFYLIGTTTADSIGLNNVSLSVLAGKRATILFRRNLTGAKIFIAVDGDLFDATNLFAASTSGSAPAWTDEIDGDYFVGLFQNVSTSLAATLYDLRLANVAMTEAQLRTEYERGEPGAEWISGSQASYITGDDSTFASDTGNWLAALGSKSISGGKLNVADGDSIYYNPVVIPIGRRVRFTVTIDSLTAGSMRYYNGSAYVIFAATAGTYTVEFTTLAANRFYISMVGGSAVVDTYTGFAIGYTSRLRTDTAAGLTALDGSTNKNDFVLSTTGVTTSPNGRRQIIRPGTLTFGGAGTQQLFGASVVDTAKKWRVVSVSGTANASVNLSLGNTGSGTQYISAQAVTAADFDIGTFASRVISGANLYATLSGAGIITNLAIVLEQTD